MDFSKTARVRQFVDRPPARGRAYGTAFAAMVLAVSIAGCGGGSNGSVLPVGVLVPFTGEYSWIGANVQPVVQEIVDEVNESGGIGGQELAVVQGDTEGTVDAGVLAARKLVNIDDVRVLIGPTSLEFAGVGRVVTDSGVPFVSPTAGTTELDTAAKELFYRTVPSDSLGGRAIARAITDPAFLGREAPFERPALMVGQAAAFVSFEEPIERGIQEFGGELAETTRYSTGKESYRSEVEELLAANPDVIILVGEPADSARIMQDAFQAGYEGTWFVTQDQTNADYIELAGPELVEGIYGLIETVPEDVSGLLDQFTERLGAKPDIFQTNTYDAANVSVLAMLAAAEAGEEVTSDAVAQHLDEVANPEQGDVVVTTYTEGKEALQDGQGIDYQGLSGPVDFNEYGNIIAPFSIQQVQNGEFTDVGNVEATDLK